MGLHRILFFIIFEFIFFRSDWFSVSFCTVFPSLRLITTHGQKDQSALLLNPTLPAQKHMASYISQCLACQKNDDQKFSLELFVQEQIFVQPLVGPLYGSQTYLYDKHANYYSTKRKIVCNYVLEKSCICNSIG